MKPLDPSSRTLLCLAESPIICDETSPVRPTRKMMGFLNLNRLLTLVRLLLAFGALAGAVTDAVGKTTPWAIIKCKFADQPQEPTFDPSFITGANGMAGYWQAVSYGQISLDGSAVYGWYTL